jgi:hypothetical protein
VGELVLPQPTPDEAGEGKQALEEAAALAVHADLSSRAELNQINELFREDRRNTHLYRLTVCGLWVIGAVYLVLFIVLAAHKVLPLSYRFLGGDDVKALTEFLFSGFLGGAVAKGSESLIKKSRDS